MCARNEAENIENATSILLSGLRNQMFRRVAVVLDGPQDDTVSLFLNSISAPTTMRQHLLDRPQGAPLVWKNIVVLLHKVSQGLGRSFAQGVQTLAYHFPDSLRDDTSVVKVDADILMPTPGEASAVKCASAISSLGQEVIQKQFPLVLGSQFEGDPWPMRAPHMATGFRAYRGSALCPLWERPLPELWARTLPQGFGCDAAFTLLLMKSAEQIQSLIDPSSIMSGMLGQLTIEDPSSSFPSMFSVPSDAYSFTGLTFGRVGRHQTDRKQSSARIASAYRFAFPQHFYRYFSAFRDSPALLRAKLREQRLAFPHCIQAILQAEDFNVS